MLLEEDIQKILDELAVGKLIKLAMHGSDIVMRFLDDSSKVYLMTSVYNGDNYIPSSVRRCMSQKAPAPHPSIRTFLAIDEQNFQINLRYLDYSDHAEQSPHALKELLEEFARIAEDWRLYLDEHDKHDLIYVRVK